MLDIVSVFYDAEAPWQLLQARSIRKYFKREDIGRVILIYNHDQDLLLPPAVAAELQAELQDFPLCLINRTEIADLTGFHGWISQQALKLLVARLLQQENYLVLDAKNHFICPVSKETFVTPGGAPRAALKNVRGSNSEPLYRNSFLYFGLNPETWLESSPVNVTPFVIPRRLAQDLIRYVEDKEEAPFQALFRRVPNISEFYLLLAFVHARGHQFSEVFADTLAPALTIWPGFLTDEDFFRNEMAKAAAGEYAAFAIHKWTLRAMSRRQRDAVVALWLSTGLVSTEEEAERYLSSPAAQSSATGAAHSIIVEGARRICNICGSDEFVTGSIRRGQDYGPPQCAKCRSLERHRAIRALYAILRPIIREWRLFQIAPDGSLESRWFKSFRHASFGSAMGIDINDTGFESGTFDLIAATYVFQRVPDDIGALRECLRVVGESGVVHICVPGPIHRWETRDIRGGQRDSGGPYRAYGADFPLRMCRAIPGMLSLAVPCADPVTDSWEMVFFFSFSESSLQEIAGHVQHRGRPIVRLA